MVDLTAAYGYACTKSTDFVWKLCNLARIMMMRMLDQETTGAYVSQ